MRTCVDRWKIAVAAALALALATLWGCGEPTSDELFASVQAQARRAAADTAAWQGAVDVAEQFLAANAAHAKAPEALKTLAMLVQQRGDMAGAIARYERLLSDYPESEAADEAQFMIGFICEEHLGEYERARQAYRLVVERYPDSELAENARRLLPNVGRPPEEWVQFEDGADAQ